MTDQRPAHSDEIAATLRASRELGPEYDDALAASVVERFDQTIDERVRHHVTTQLAQKETARAGVPANTVRFVLALVLLGVSIPVTGIVAGVGSASTLPLIWLGMIVFYVIAILGLRR